MLQWLIVHSDTIQSILRGQDVSMGSLQELSLLTGIISKTALPGMDYTVHRSLSILLYRPTTKTIVCFYVCDVRSPGFGTRSQQCSPARVPRTHWSIPGIEKP